MMILAIMATGCKKKSQDLNYKESEPLELALRDEHKINVSSDYDVTYTSSNPLCVEANYHNINGNIFAKNVGSAQLTMSNGYNSKTVTVNVSLFIQPTFDFGCRPSVIESLYGQPYQSGYNPDDNYLVYRYTMKTNEGNYSWACGEMDFFFDDDKYVEADVYVREGVDYMLNKYLDDNFNIYDSLYIHISETDSVFAHIYRNKIDETVFCGKYFSGDQWNETKLFYFPVTDTSKGIKPRKVGNINR